jgi:hypothetical protein
MDSPTNEKGSCDSCTGSVIIHFCKLGRTNLVVGNLEYLGASSIIPR